MSAAARAAIRVARRSDVSAIAAQWERLLAAHASLDAAFALTADAGAALQRQVTRALEDADAALWVGERDGHIVAFCAVHVAHSSPPVREPRRLEISELFVAEDARRCGLGRSLVEAAVAWARERGAARVEVRVVARNAAAQAFWRSLGFGAFVDVLDRRL